MPEDSGKKKKKKKYASFIQKACCRWSNEINSQKRLLEAEEGQLVTLATTFSSADLLQEIKGITESFSDNIIP
jgi:hypothetical protein